MLSRGRQAIWTCLAKVMGNQRYGSLIPQGSVLRRRVPRGGVREHVAVATKGTWFRSG
jgi:hypothetical protein